MIKKRGLGIGLESLLGEINRADLSVLHNNDIQSFRMVPLDTLAPSVFQPRHVVPEASLKELADSIRAQGIIQPIIVRVSTEPHTDDRYYNQYEIIAGERRWRAAQLAGLSEVPILIKQITDQMAMAVALIENIQREDLNPIEEAGALEQLTKTFDMTHAQLAKITGKSRTTITNSLRLLSLNDDIKTLLEHKQLASGHARALLALNHEHQITAAARVIRNDLSVRATEQLVKRLANPVNPTITHDLPEITKQLQRLLKQNRGIKSSIHPLTKNSGKLVLHYDDIESLNRLLELLT